MTADDDDFQDRMIRDNDAWEAEQRRAREVLSAVPSFESAPELRADSERVFVWYHRDGRSVKYTEDQIVWVDQKKRTWLPNTTERVYSKMMGED